MFALFARLTCGFVVLLSFAGNHGSSAPTPPEASVDACADIAEALDVVPIAVVAENDTRSAMPIETAGPALYRVYRITAYCDRGVTAAGVDSGVGQCAAPAGIPFGSRIYIPELGRTFVVTDRTARRFRQNTVDLFMPSRTECKQFGCKYLDCEITFPVREPRYGSRGLLSAVAAIGS